MTADLERCRQAAQVAFAAGSEPLEVGSLANTGFDLATLKTLQAGDAVVKATIDSGLTAWVLQLVDADGRRWALKRAWQKARVQNVDGATSFLNEVQRRADFGRLKREPGGEERWAGIVDTQFASYRDGLMLSPWIDGQPVGSWDERRLESLFGLICSMWLEGLFEWDLCPGNLLDDGQRVRLFDFGYCYRFDPIRQFSSAGRGDDRPLFHPVERFESRCFCAQLLEIEQLEGEASAIAAFRIEKRVAIEAYRRMRSVIAGRGASATVLQWLDGICSRWQLALTGNLEDLYLAENWRSHALDLDDDLRGRSCTAMTLRRADWLLAALDRHGDALRAQRAFFWADADADLPVLRERYRHHRRQAEAFQLAPASVF
jgi:hypothetical protein